MLADFNFLREVLPNNPRNWTWEVLEVEESKNHIQKIRGDDLLALFDESSAVTGFEGPLSGHIFEVKKIQFWESEVKAVVCENEKMSIKSINFSFFQ